MKKLKGLIIATALLICTATAGAVQTNAFCSGDINGDGRFSVADAVLMQQYLLNSLNDSNRMIFENADTVKKADLNSDGVLDVFDFVMMRDKLVNPTAERNITREEFLDLILSKEEFTWSDFEQYKSENIVSGTYILKYEVEFEDSSDNVFLYVCGDSMDEMPDRICLERADGETVDIYELRKELVYFIDGFKAPEDTKTNRNNVQKIADYAFIGLKDGTFDLQTDFDYEDIADNAELLDLWHESHCLYFDFVDEHTVKIVLDGGGFFEVYGYLVTDGTVEYGTGWLDSIDVDYDGGGVEIKERHDNLYFFHAGL